MLKIPTHCYVGTVKIPIKRVHIIDNDPNTNGCFDDDEITLLEKYKNDEQSKINLFHEMIHAHCFYFGINFKSEKLEEDFVKQVEGFFHTLFDPKNAEVLKFFMKKVKDNEQ